MDYDLTQNAIKTLFKVPPGEEGFREIDITSIINATIPRLGLFGQLQNEFRSGPEEIGGCRCARLLKFVAGFRGC